MVVADSNENLLRAMMLAGLKKKGYMPESDDAMQYADEHGNLWKWLKDAPIGYRVLLHDGRQNAYRMAKRYNREVTIKRMPTGDYELTVVK